MPEQTNILPGTLDVLILKAVSLGPQHGYGVLLRVGQITGGAFLSSRERCIRHCTGWNIAVSWRPSGELQTTTVVPSSTA